MALMTLNDQKKVWRKFMNDLSKENESLGSLSKNELLTAVQDADQWMDTNQGSAKTALSLAARTELTASQIARLYAYVLEQRYLLGV